PSDSSESLHAAATPCPPRPGGISMPARQLDDELRTNANLALDSRPPAVPLDDAVHDRQSQPGAVRLVGCERLEHAAEHRWRDAASMIRDDDGYVGADAGRLARRDHDLTARLARLHGVLEHVPHDLTHLIGVRVDRREARGDRQLNRRSTAQ